MIRSKACAAGRWLSRRAHRGTRDAESGVALVMVIGSMLVLAMLAMSALAYTMQSEKFARHSQDYSAAMTAAQSGIEGFLSRLNRNDHYGNTVDCLTNPALRGPACGDAAAGWSPVDSAATDPKAASFHLVLNNTGRATGELGITSTGRVNGVYRTVVATVGKGGSTDYVYYTDFESADPSNVQAYPPSGSTTPRCGGITPATVSSPAVPADPRHWYDGRSGQGCTEITFISDDTLDGAVFTNDAIRSDHAHFLKGLETANPACPKAGDPNPDWNACLRSGSTADFGTTKPIRAAPKYLDDTSAAFITNPGCHYFGATRVVFNAIGTTMTVWNKIVNNGGSLTGLPGSSGWPVSIPPPGGPAPDCGTLAALDSTDGATLPVPPEMVLYVGTAPTVKADGTPLLRRQCNSGEIGGASGRTLPLGDFDRALVPATINKSTTYTYKYDTNMTETTKYCAEGNLYIEGTLSGRTTIAAAQSVVVTGDLVLAGGLLGDDMLGLVATNSVEVYHPRIAPYSVRLRDAACDTVGATSYRYCPNSGATVADLTWPTRYADPTFSPSRYEPPSGIQIAGSIQTLQHSFLVQKYNEGTPAGQLLVNGSIAQRWRGIVGTGSGAATGYTKLYKYDSRLVFAPPPYFPRWALSQWSMRYSGEANTLANVRS